MGGGLILKDEKEKEEAEKDERVEKYIRPYLNARELIHGGIRWVLWLKNSTREDRQAPFIRKRFEEVRSAREGTSNEDRAPWLFESERQPEEDYLAIPSVFSEKRKYFLAEHESSNVVASNLLFTVEDPEGLAFSVIESSMFMAWQDLVGGRLEMRKRFSNTLVWNTFPLPKLTKEQKDRIIEGGRKVLESRALIRQKDPTASLADMYSEPAVLDPDLEKNLLKAHEALDKAVDSAFSDKPLKSEEERQRALLEMYKKMTNEK